MERLIRKLYFGLLSRLHPELDRVEDEDERMRVSMVAGMSEPRWLRSFYFAVFVLLLPFAGAVFAVVAAASMNINSKYNFVFIFGGGMTGYVVPTTIFHLVRLREIRRKHFETMINVGYDTCPFCAYDLTGHVDEHPPERICPECGASLHPPPALSEDPNETSGGHQSR